jgi:AraC-like DNA-binding protein
MNAKRFAANKFFEKPGFPISVHRIMQHGPAPMHRHDFHELVVIFSGAGRHVAGNDDYPISAGDVFVIKGDIAHGYRDTEGLGLMNILFRPERLNLQRSDLHNVPGFHTLFTIEPTMRQDDQFRSRLRLSRTQLSEAMRLATILEAELKTHKPGYRFLARAHLMGLIGFLSRCYSQPRHKRHGALFRLGNVLSFIDTNYDQPITVVQLAQMAAMSESTLTRRFRKALGRSAIEHILRVRIMKAETLLLEQDVNITEVAFSCGFNDANYFSRQFRKLKGCSPREHRATHGG